MRSVLPENIKVVTVGNNSTLLSSVKTFAKNPLRAHPVNNMNCNVLVAAKCFLITEYNFLTKSVNTNYS